MKGVHTLGVEDDPGNEQRWLTDGPPTFKVNCVCGPCNSGWMSSIETAAKPLLIEMIEGRPVSLSRVDESAVATWLALKSIIALHMRKNAFSDDWAQRFYADHHRPPSEWKVRIGRYIGARLAKVETAALNVTGEHSLSPFPVKRSDLYLFTVRAGQFIGQVIGSKQPVSFLRPNGRSLVPIWPPPLLDTDFPVRSPLDSPNEWPPERGIDDEDFEKAAHDAMEPRD